MCAHALPTWGGEGRRWVGSWGRNITISRSVSDTPLRVDPEVALARMRLARCLVVLLAVAVADEADDTRAAAAADHLRAGELKELLTKAGVEFGCAHCH